MKCDCRRTFLKGVLLHLKKYPHNLLILFQSLFHSFTFLSDIYDLSPTSTRCLPKASPSPWARWVMQHVLGETWRENQRLCSSSPPVFPTLGKEARGRVGAPSVRLWDTHSRVSGAHSARRRPASCPVCPGLSTVLTLWARALTSDAGPCPAPASSQLSALC